MQTTQVLKEIFDRMHDHFGAQQWWPGETPFEVMVGAVLTQNTNWNNVERAIDNLKGAGVLSLAKMSTLPTGLLAEYIRPAGYYNIKATRLQNLFAFLNEQYQGNLDDCFQQSQHSLREQLLMVKGVGPETADCILLYAACLPAFVVDTYTHRILLRHQLIDETFGYYEVQDFFTDALQEDVQFFNEYHALLVQVGKNYCRKTNPKCETCPLNGV